MKKGDDCDIMIMESRRIERNVKDMANYYEKQQKAYIELMDNYIKKIETLPEEEKEMFAKKSLVESGILTKNGNIKKMCMV